MSVSPFILNITVLSSSLTVGIRLGINGSLTIDWGDTTSTNTSFGSFISHTYPSSGNYTISITGTSLINITRFNGIVPANYLRSVVSWGGFAFTSLDSAFRETDATLTYVPQIPLTVTIIDGIFYQASNLTIDLSWNVSNVTSMANAFGYVSNFSPNISGWNVSNVTNMQGIFLNTSNFIIDISGWNVSNVTNMALMFYGSNFNQPIGNWTVSSVTDMSRMFANSTFNQPIGNWNVSNVTTMEELFFNAPFNQNLGNWKLSSLTNGVKMFSSSMSLQNINSTLYGWSTKSPLTTNVTITFPGYYSDPSGTIGYNTLTSSTYNWTFTELTLINVGSKPAITSIDGGVGSLSVNFTASTGGNPPVITYYYSFDRINYTNANQTTSPIVIAVSNGSYDVSIIANNLAGNTVPSDVVRGQTYLIGSAPVITSVLPDASLNTLSVSFTGSTGGYPPPTTYYYSLNQGSYINANKTTSPIRIPDLSNQIYTVTLIAQNIVGNTSVSNDVSGRPYIIGTAPVINSITSIIGGLTVNFTGSTGSYPTPIYYYSINGGIFNNSGSSSSPIDVSGLTIGVSTNIRLIGVNNGGNTSVSNDVSGIPYIVGSEPIINDVVVSGTTVTIYFTGSTGGYPTPNIKYSLNGGTYAQASSNSSPIVVNNVTFVLRTVKLSAENTAGTAYSSVYNIQGTWLSEASTSNRYKQSYFQGFVDISGGSLIVRNSDVSFNNDLLIGGNIRIGKNVTLANLTVTANETIGGTLAVTGNTTVSNIAVNSNATIGNASIGGVLSVTGNTSVSNIRTTANTDVSGTLVVTGNTTLSNLRTTANTDVSGTLVVTGNTTLSNLRTTANTDVSGTLVVTGNSIFSNIRTTANTDVSGTLVVTGNSIFSNIKTTANTDISGTLVVTGNSIFSNIRTTANTDISGTLVVTGNTTLSNLRTTANTNVIGTLGVTGNSIFSNIKTTANTDVSGTLVVTGNTNLSNLRTTANTDVSGTLVVTGNTNLSNISVNANATIGNSNIGGVLNVTGNTTLSNVAVNGLSTLNGNILLSNVYLHQTSNISTTPTTLSYPLYQTYNITLSSATSITLPNIANGTNIVGVTLNFFKSGSATTVITIQSAGTDLFITNGTVTQSSTYTIPSGVTSSMLIACAGTPNYWTAIGGGGGGGSESAGSFANIAVNKSTVDAGYVMDVCGNTKITGNIVIGNGLTVSSGTVSFPSGSISTSAIASGFVDTSTTQNIGGAKTFTTAPVMSGANISSGTISTTSLGFTFVDMSNTQTIGGAKTFTTAPVMSGANISSGTISTTSLGFTFVDMSNTQTIGGAKTFSVAPIMSGANISNGTISTNSLGFTFVDMSNAQTIGGVKTFSVAPVMSGANISNGTISTNSLGFTFVDMSNAQTIGGVKTFSVAPVMSGANISSGTIPTSAVASGFVDTSTTQNIGGAKTFTTAPVMSGANISSGTISTTSLGFTFVDMSNTQTIGGAKTFSVAPIMSGVNISSGTIQTTSLGFTFVDMSNTQTVGGSKTFSGVTTFTGNISANSLTITPTQLSFLNAVSSAKIGQSQITNGYVDLSGDQSIGGVKTFSGNVNLNGNISLGNINLYQIANISTTTTLSYPLSQTYNITSTSDTIITLPTIASGTSIIGDVINFYKSGSATILVTIQSVDSTDKFITNGTITQATTFTIPSGTTSATLIACAGTPNYWTAIGGGSSSTFSNIAINKSSVDSGYVLDVSGNAKVSGNVVIGNGITITGNASISGNVTAVSYNATSDRRLKANIQPLHSQWDSILSVEPVSFDWTVDGRTDIGFIAQDVYKSYPHLKPNYKTADPSFNEEEPVDLSGNPIYYTIDYGRMTPFLWQGMKEIMQKLDRLETENKKLVERIAVLESK